MSMRSNPAENPPEKPGDMAHQTEPPENFHQREPRQ